MAKQTPKLLGLRAYARHRRVSLSTVQAAIKSGRLSESIKNVKGQAKVDPDLADREWAENTDHAKANRGTTRPPDPEVSGSYQKAKAVRETALAKIATLTYQEKSGELVKLEEVKKTWYDAGRAVRNAILSIPDRMAPILAAETDAHKIHVLLKEELTNALQEISRVGRNQSPTEE